MRHFARLSLALLAAAVLWASPVIAQSNRPTVAVLNFDFGSIEHWWSGNQDIGAGIADLIVDGLVDDGSWRVFERKKLDTLLGEQDFNQSDRVDPTAKAAKLGKMIGVKYLIYGSITKFGTENSSKGVNAGAFGGGKLGLGAVGTSQGKANVAIAARVCDTSTGEVLIVAKGDGTSKRSGFMLGGAGGGGGKGGGGSINFGASDFHDTIIGEATEVAVKAVIAKMVSQKDRLK